MTKSIVALIALASTFTSTTRATDFLCLQGNIPFAQPFSVPTVNLSSVVVTSPLLTIGAQQIGNAMYSTQRPLQQINVSDSIGQAAGLDGGLVFSPAETKRQLQSGSCDQAYDSLLKTFAANRLAMGYPIPGRDGLALFASWYLNPVRTADEKLKSEPVVNAQKDFAKACLSSVIPDELNPEKLRAVIGILSFDDQPFCSAFRTSQTDVLTARHCFVLPTGELQEQTKGLLSKKGRIWFQYEAEPNNRYEVCEAGLPKEKTSPFNSSGDNIVIKIAKTGVAAPDWAWRPVPLKAGSSLYMRGYSPFSEGVGPLEKLRATAHGGCAAIAAKDRCVFHACQSTSIMSGAPIFTRPEPGVQSAKLELIGIHLGTANIASNETPRACQGIDGKKYSYSNFAFQPEGIKP